MFKRNESLDALRGFAILAMVLSGAIAYGNVLPDWMFHAQVPPPEHKFNPAIPGITWVDLVFPFFLFSMGAAIPLSLQKHINNGRGLFFVLKTAFKRFFLLAFFALFTQHLKAWVITGAPTAKEHVLSLLAFLLLFFQFYEHREKRGRHFFMVAKYVSFAIALFLLWKLPFHNGSGFSFYKSDIIIMVLANMALFGTVMYYFTVGRPWLRIGLLPFVMAVFLAAKDPGDGWAKTLFHFSHIGELRFDWLYKFYFLKYLFIIIPGTLAGEMMMKQAADEPAFPNKTNERLLLLVSFALVLVNVYALFARLLFANLLASAILCFAALYLLKHKVKTHLYKQLFSAGAYLLLLGLFFEAYEGGIKKDSSTYSYYFVTGGLAFFCLVLFSLMAQQKYLSQLVRYLSLNGKNPMVAYVAGSLLVLPLLSITGLKGYWNSMNQDFFMGLMKGVLFTGLVSLVTIFFVKRGWFWKS